MSDNLLHEDIRGNTQSKLSAYDRRKASTTTRRKTSHTVQTVDKRGATTRVKRLQFTDARHPIEAQAIHDAALDNPRWTTYLTYKAQCHHDTEAGAIARLYVTTWNATINRR